MDYGHHSTFVEPHKYNRHIHIIGVGATGSWVAVLLHKLGIKNVSCVDFDTVEEHNVCNQAYSETAIGKGKVNALRDAVAPCNEGWQFIMNKATSLITETGVIFNLVDSMEARKELFKTCINPNAELYIETRLATDGGRLYIINPMCAEHRKKYEATLYDDGVAEVSACGTSQTIAPTAMMLASKAVWECMKHQEHLNGNAFFGEILFDVYGNEVRTEW